MQNDAAQTSRFSEKILRILERTTYRCVRSEDEREPIYKLRYAAYMREASIAENPQERFTDAYDHSPNVWVMAMYIDGDLASSIRLHIGSHQDPMPGRDVFCDVLEPHLDAGRVIVDPTRHVTNYEATKEYPELPFLTVRSAWMAGEHFQADYILATVRLEHRAFFKRAFRHEDWSEPREYPALRRPIVCMGMSYPDRKHQVETRFPHYRSTEAERIALFGCDPAAAQLVAAE